jgi:hypothetical protein
MTPPASMHDAVVTRELVAASAGVAGSWRSRKAENMTRTARRRPRPSALGYRWGRREWGIGRTSRLTRAKMRYLTGK